MAKQVSLEELLSATDIDKRIADLSFEEAMRILEELVAKVESGSLPLDKAIHSYEKGVMLIDRLRSLLTGAEEKLKVLQRPGSPK